MSTKPIEIKGSIRAYIGEDEILCGEFAHLEWLGRYWAAGTEDSPPPKAKQLACAALSCVRKWDGLEDAADWPPLPADLTLDDPSLAARWAWLCRNIGIPGLKKIDAAVTALMKLPEEQEKN